MTKDNIMIDLTGKKPHRYNVNVCYYCQEDGKHTPKPILPEDKNARHLGDKSWICGTCIIQRQLSLFGGNTDAGTL